MSADGRERPAYISNSISNSISLGSKPGPSRHRGGSSSNNGVVHSQAMWSPRERKIWLALLFLGAVALYLSRMSLPVVIVELADVEDWDKQTCGIILSSFFWGYVLLQVIGGNLADRYGGDLVIWTTGLVWSLASVFIIYAIHVSTGMVIAVRFVIGLAQGVYFPAAASLVSHRAPEEMKTYYFSILSAGTHCGNVLTGCLGALFLFNNKWQYIFVIVGLAGLLWTFAVRYFSSLLHRNHRTHYKLNDSTSQRQRLKLDVPQTATMMASCAGVPWRKLLTQPAVIAMLLGHTSACYVLFNLMSWLPTFFHETFPDHSDMSWLYNGLPWVSMGTGSVLGGLFATKLLERDLSMTRVRKTMAVICLAGGGLFLLLIPALPHSPDNDSFSPTLLLVALAFLCSGTGSSCFLVNPLDLSPSYVGSLTGIMNTCGALPGVFGVSLTGHILHSTGSWTIVFAIMTTANLFALVVYLVFGSGKKLQLDPS